MWHKVRRKNHLWRSMLAGLCLLMPFSANAQTVTLNLKDADISALISTVAEITGKNFIIDPRVKGKVTVVSSTPMDKQQIYDVFLSVLDVHGFAVIPSDGVLKIVPDVNAKAGSIPTMGIDKEAAGDAMATKVIAVQNVSAAQLVPILRPLVPQQGHLAAYPSTNVLVISDRASNIERLTKIIDRIDQASDSEIEVITLQHASASELARILSSFAKPNPGEAGAPGGAPTFIADERTNSILISGDKNRRLPMRAIIAHLDTPLASTGNTRVIYLRYAQAEDMAKVLKGVGTTEGKDPTKAVVPGVAAASGGVPFDIQADESTNALVITAPQDIMRSLEAVIRQLDVRRAQVLVEAVIAEVSDSKAKQLGVEWIVDGSPGGHGPVGMINFGGIASALAAASGTVPSILPTGALIGGGRIDDDKVDFGVLLRALATDGATNILSTPTLVTLDNEEAEIVIGQNVPFVTGSFTGTNTDGTGGGSGLANPFQTIERQDVGLTLKIKPQINEGNAIKLDIQQEVSSLSASAVAGASDLVTDKRSIKTSVMVDDGKMVVLGGLIEDNVTESVSKVPLLGDVPLLGALFRSTSTNKGKKNLMVFIHPVILRDDAVADHYTSGKYNYIRDKQVERDKQGIKLMPGEPMPTLPRLEDMLSGQGAVSADAEVSSPPKAAPAPVYDR